MIAFNIGVKIGQLCTLHLALPLLHYLFKHAFAEKPGVILLSALVAHTAWHWMKERGASHQMKHLLMLYLMLTEEISYAHHCHSR